MTPTILGFPLWTGKIKRRVAKKYLRMFHNMWMLNPHGRSLSKLGVGDFVNDCSGKNGRILSLSPTYRRIGKGVGAILLDVDMQTENTGCSLCNCGIELKMPRDLLEKRMVEHMREWTLGEGGKTWYGENTDEYKQVVETARTKIAIIENGGHVLDEDGRSLPELESVSL